MHRIVEDCNKAIANHLQFPNEPTQESPVDTWNSFTAIAAVPSVVKNITKFFFEDSDGDPNVDFLVHGLSISDTDPEQHQDFWTRLFDSDGEHATTEAINTKAQVIHMGIAVDAFLNETQMYPHVLKNYYKVTNND